MSNLPDSLYEDYLVSSGSGSGASSSSATAPPDVPTLCRWIKDIEFPASRTSALQLLANNKDVFGDLARLLWSSVGTVATLLQEVIEIYPELSSSALTQRTSNRVFNALLLFQCLAAHPETRMRFLKAMMPHYLYPFLTNKYMGKPHEYLRVGSLGVIAALVKPENAVVIRFVVESEALPGCLHSIEIGSMQSKTIATFIIQKILMNDEGLKYSCVLAERFYAIEHGLECALDALAATDKPSPELLQLVMACYFRLSVKARARESLRRFCPFKLSDNTFIKQLCEDPVAMAYRQQLLVNLRTRGYN